MLSRLANYVASFAVACSITLSGCGGNSNVTEERVTPPEPLTAKQLLLQVSETGGLGSGSFVIREELEKLKATDAAKANELIKDLDQLEKISDPSRVQTMAKKMAAKL